MSSRTKRIGNIGEQAIITELLQYPDIIVSKSITDNEPYDIIIDYKDVLYRVQIKTTEFVKDNTMRFCTSKNKNKELLYSRTQNSIWIYMDNSYMICSYNMSR